MGWEWRSCRAVVTQWDTGGANCCPTLGSCPAQPTLEMEFQGNCAPLGINSKENQITATLRHKAALGSFFGTQLLILGNSTFQTTLGNFLQSRSSAALGAPGYPGKWDLPGLCWKFAFPWKLFPGAWQQNRVTAENDIIHTGIILLKRRTVCYYGEFCKFRWDNTGKRQRNFLYNFQLSMRCSGIFFFFSW